MPGLLDPEEYDRRLAARDPWRAWGDRFRRQVARSRTPEEAAEDAARQRANPLTLMEGIEAASMSPSPLGDVASGVLAARDLAAGDYLGAGLNAVGLLPLVPALGGMLARAPDAIPEAARRLGFTTPVWHGTDAAEDFAAFDPNMGESFAVHVATRPETAARRLQITEGESPRVLPMLARIDPGRTLRLADAGDWSDWRSVRGEWFGDRGPVRTYTPYEPFPIPEPLRADLAELMEGMRREGDMFLDAHETFPQALRDTFLRHDINAIRYPNHLEGIGEDSLAILDPSLLRMRWAAFDPRRIDSADLLAGLAPATLATGVTLRGLLGDDDDDGAM